MLGFFFSYCRIRQEGIKVLTWQQAEELWDRLHEQHHLPGPPWPVQCLRFRAQQRGVGRLTGFIPEIWAINPPLESAEEWEVLHGKTREPFQPQNLPVLRHLGRLSEAESRGENPGCKSCGRMLTLVLKSLELAEGT